MFFLKKLLKLVLAKDYDAEEPVRAISLPHASSLCSTHLLVQGWSHCCETLSFGRTATSNLKLYSLQVSIKKLEVFKAYFSAFRIDMKTIFQ